MAAKVFQLLDGGMENGHNVYTASTASGSLAIEPGLLVLAASGSTYSQCDASTNPVGIAYGLRYTEYRPTSRAFGASEPFTLIQGHGQALLSVDFFASGALPTAGNKLYSAANGKYATSGSKVVGWVKEIVVRKEAVGGVGADQSLAYVYFNISPELS